MGWSGDGACAGWRVTRKRHPPPASGAAVRWIGNLAMLTGTFPVGDYPETTRSFLRNIEKSVRYRTVHFGLFTLNRCEHTVAISPFNSPSPLRLEMDGKLCGSADPFSGRLP
jgi:hypothetical protein